MLSTHVYHPPWGRGMERIHGIPNAWLILRDGTSVSTRNLREHQASSASLSATNMWERKTLNNQLKSHRWSHANTFFSPHISSSFQWISWVYPHDTRGVLNCITAAWVVPSGEFGGDEGAQSTSDSVRSCTASLLRNMFLGFPAPSIFFVLHLRLRSPQLYIPGGPAEDSENTGR